MRTETKLPDGREIIAREQALGEHPHPSQNNRLVPFNGVTKLLIADGTEMYECDGCGWTADNCKSVAAHMPSHIERGPMYPVETIKLVLRIVAHARQEHGKYAIQEAIKVLTTRGIKTAHGNPWSPGAVGSLVRQYANVYPVRIRRSTPKVLSAAADTAVITNDNGVLTIDHPMSTLQINEKLDDLMRQASGVIMAAKALTNEVKALHAAVQPPVIDPEILAKAEKYDALRGLIQN